MSVKQYISNINDSVEITDFSDLKELLNTVNTDEKQELLISAIQNKQYKMVSFLLQNEITVNLKAIQASYNKYMANFHGDNDENCRILALLISKMIPVKEVWSYIDGHLAIEIIKQNPGILNINDANGDLVKQKNRILYLTHIYLKKNPQEYMALLKSLNINDIKANEAFLLELIPVKPNLLERIISFFNRSFKEKTIKKYQKKFILNQFEEDTIDNKKLLVQGVIKMYGLFGLEKNYSDASNYFEKIPKTQESIMDYIYAQISLAKINISINSDNYNEEAIKKACLHYENIAHIKQDEFQFSEHISKGIGNTLGRIKEIINTIEHTEKHAINQEMNEHSKGNHFFQSIKKVFNIDKKKFLKKL